MKYEIRSIHEKLDILIQNSEENSMTKTRDSDVFDTFITDGRLPIENEEKLETFENDLSSDKNFRNQLVCHVYNIITFFYNILV